MSSKQQWTNGELPGVWPGTGDFPGYLAIIGSWFSQCRVASAILAEVSVQNSMMVIIALAAAARLALILFESCEERALRN